MSKVTVNTNVAFEGDIGKPYIDSSKIIDFGSFVRNNPSLIEQLDNFDTSNGTKFTDMFYGCSSLVTIPLLDTSKGTAFNNMFQNCSSLVTIPLLDTSKGTEFGNMFYGCQKLQTVPQLDTSNGNTLSNMFGNCSSLVTAPLLDMKKSTYCFGVFSGCTKLETVHLTTSKAPFQTNTFQNCTALKNLTIGEGWAVNIYLHYSNNLTVESLHGMIENLADLTGQTEKTFQIGATNLAKIDDEHIQMLNDKNWNYS